MPNLTQEYTKDLEEQLQAAFKTVRRHTAHCQWRQKHFYDRRLRGTQVQRGDQVLIRNVTPQGKLDDRWSEEVYIVTSQPSADAPVYHLIQEGRKGRPRTLHRTLLLPISSSDSSESLDSATPVKPSSAPEQVPQQVPDGGQAEPDTPANKNRTTANPVAEGATSGEAVSDGKAAQPQGIKTKGAVEPDILVEGTLKDIRTEPEVKDSDPEMNREASNSNTASDSVSFNSDCQPDHSLATSSAPMRPQRMRRPPAWMSSGNFRADSHQTRVLKEIKILMVKLKQKYQKSSEK